MKKRKKDKNEIIAEIYLYLSGISLLPIFIFYFIATSEKMYIYILFISLIIAIIFFGLMLYHIKKIKEDTTPCVPDIIKYTKDPIEQIKNYCLKRRYKENEIENEYGSDIKAYIKYGPDRCFIFYIIKNKEISSEHFNKKREILEDYLYKKNKRLLNKHIFLIECLAAEKVTKAFEIQTSSGSPQSFRFKKLQASINLSSKEIKISECREVMHEWAYKKLRKMFEKSIELNENR